MPPVSEAGAGKGWRDPPAGRPANRAQAEHTLASFLDALEAGDEAKLLESLAADAVLYGDGGGKGPSVVNPIYGADRIVRFLMGLRRKYSAYTARAYRRERDAGADCPSRRRSVRDRELLGGR